MWIKILRSRSSFCRWIPRSWSHTSSIRKGLRTDPTSLIQNMLMWHTRQGLIKLSLPIFYPDTASAEYQSDSFCRNLLSQLPFLSILSASSAAKTRLNAFCRNLLTPFTAFRYWYDWFSPLFRVCFFCFSNLVRFLRAFFFCIHF